ncbi:unnamed protein product [Amoebophrya sp. A25]|nr:unnamed protein product [Amoebophrya sp. A25]|eukprot:GSA25T00023009001.1
MRTSTSSTALTRRLEGEWDFSTSSSSSDEDGEESRPEKGFLRSQDPRSAYLRLKVLESRSRSKRWRKRNMSAMLDEEAEHQHSHRKLFQQQRRQKRVRRLAPLLDTEQTLMQSPALEDAIDEPLHYHRMHSHTTTAGVKHVVHHGKNYFDAKTLALEELTMDIDPDQNAFDVGGGGPIEAEVESVPMRRRSTSSMQGEGRTPNRQSSRISMPQTGASGRRPRQNMTSSRRMSRGSSSVSLSGGTPATTGGSSRGASRNITTTTGTRSSSSQPQTTRLAQNESASALLQKANFDQFSSNFDFGHFSSADRSTWYQPEELEHTLDGEGRLYDTVPLYLSSGGSTGPQPAGSLKYALCVFAPVIKNRKKQEERKAVDGDKMRKKQQVVDERESSYSSAYNRRQRELFDLRIAELRQEATAKSLSIRLSVLQADLLPYSTNQIRTSVQIHLCGREHLLCPNGIAWHTPEYRSAVMLSDCEFPRDAVARISVLEHVEANEGEGGSVWDSFNFLGGGGGGGAGKAGGAEDPIQQRTRNESTEEADVKTAGNADKQSTFSTNQQGPRPTTSTSGDNSSGGGLLSGISNAIGNLVTGGDGGSQEQVADADSRGTKTTRTIRGNRSSSSSMTTATIKNKKIQDLAEAGGDENVNDNDGDKRKMSIAAGVSTASAQEAANTKPSTMELGSTFVDLEDRFLHARCRREMQLGKAAFESRPLYSCFSRGLATGRLILRTEVVNNMSRLLQSSRSSSAIGGMGQVTSEAGLSSGAAGGDVLLRTQHRFHTLQLQIAVFDLTDLIFGLGLEGERDQVNVSVVARMVLDSGEVIEETTDVHRRVAPFDGRAVFNWRLVFPDLPLDLRNATVSVTAYANNLIFENEPIGEALLDFGEDFKLMAARASTPTENRVVLAGGGSGNNISGRFPLFSVAFDSAPFSWKGEGFGQSASFDICSRRC